MDKINLILPAVLIVLIIGVIGISGCVDKVYTNDPVFNERGVYFEHPSNWANYRISGEEIAKFGNNSIHGNLWSGEQIIVSKYNESEWSAEMTINKFKTFNDVNYTVGSVMVDSINATLISYTWNNVNGEFNRNYTDTVVKGTDVIFKKNGYTYLIEYYTAPPENYNEQTFKNIINSFKVQ